MRVRPSLTNSLDLLAAALASAALLGVLQTFLIGRHYIIPTALLFWAVLFGNLARYGLAGRLWAKQILFWIFFVFTGHLLFAVFFTQRYREWLGDAWEWVGGGLFLLFAFLTVQYARQNALFRADGAQNS